MNSELKVVNEQEVLGKVFRIYGTIEEPLFLAKDVAEWIDYDKSQLSKMLKNVDDEEKVRNNVTTLGGIQNTWFLTEDGLYEVLMQSRKPIAKQFKKKVKEILKGLRKGELTITKTNEQLKAKLLLDIYNGGQQGVIASKELTEIEVQEATQPLISKIEEDKPKVEYAESVLCSKDTIDVMALAKIIKDEGIKMNRNQLYQWLRDKGYLMENSNRYNQPYQKWINEGLFEYRQYTVDTPYGKKINFKPLITPLGQIKIVETLKKELL